MSATHTWNIQVLPNVWITLAYTGYNTYHLYLRPGNRGNQKAGRFTPLHGLGRSRFDRFGRLPGV